MERPEIVNDWPENECFACSPHNPRGLQMKFVRIAPLHYESRYTADASLSGFGGVVHGGLQATLLDDTMAMVAREQAGDPDAHVVTAELSIQYRRPVPVGEPLLIRASLERLEGRSYHISGEIRAVDGELLTRASARWMIPRDAPPVPAGHSRVD